MRLTRVYIDAELTPGREIVLPDSVMRHLIQVLRLERGAGVVLFNGDGKDYPANLVDVQKKRAVAHIERAIDVNNESPVAIHLGQAMSRGDRMDYTIQKAVELGVYSITPLSSERSTLNLKGERSEKKLAHWKGIIASACEQSGRARLPELRPMESVDSWCESAPKIASKLVLAPEGGHRLAELSRSNEIFLLIGSEGGLSSRELARSRNFGFSVIGIGPRILRTETAGLAAISIIQSMWGDL